MAAEIEIKRYLTEGWEMFSANMMNLLVASIIMVVVIMGGNALFFAGMVVTGPLMGGFYYILLDLNSGEQFNMKRLFDGFVLSIVPLVLAGIVIHVFTIIGILLFLLPGVLITGWYLFTYLFIVDREMDFWSAMEASREVAFQNQVGIFLFALALVGINFLGMIPLGLGLIITFPLSMCAIFKAYEDLVGLVDDPANTVGGGRVMDSKPKMHVEPPPVPEDEEGK